MLKVLVATASSSSALTSARSISFPDRLASVDRQLPATRWALGTCGGRYAQGRLFPLSRDDLVECAALIDSVKRGELDRLMIPSSLDVVAQQIVAEVSAREWRGELFDVLRRAWPYRALTREQFAEIVAMLADGFSSRAAGAVR